MRRFLALIIILPFILSPICFAGEEPGGKHTGELKDLEIKIVYKGYRGMEHGIPVYYITDTMRFEVQLINKSARTFEHLDIIVIQEYHESGICDRWWYPYPRYVTYTKGQPLPGNSTSAWSDITLRGNQSITLNGLYYIPLPCCKGIDQTHVIIKHKNQGNVVGAIMYENPEHALFCPPEPEE